LIIHWRFTRNMRRLAPVDALLWSITLEESMQHDTLRRPASRHGDEPLPIGLDGEWVDVGREAVAPGDETGPWWQDLDQAVLDCIRLADGAVSTDAIAARVGISASAVQSVVALLAQEGRVRIAAVTTPGR
jgi:hypothetical protein